jgi:hypothetical protein
MKKIIGLLFLAALVSCSKTDDNINEDVSYTNLQPDVLVTDSFFMDVNKDGEKDIKLYVEKVYQGNSPSGNPTYNYFARGIALKSNVSVSAGMQYSVSQNLWNCLQFGSFVSSELSWTDSLTLRGNMVGKGAMGVWDINPSYDFMGVKFKDGTKSNYGRVRLIDNYHSLAVNPYEMVVGEYA